MTTPERTDEELLNHYPVLKFFGYGHLPPYLAYVSESFHTLAWDLVRELDGGQETAAGLRKLLEAKDCFVRTAVDQHDRATEAGEFDV